MEPKTIKWRGLRIKPLWYHTEKICDEIYHLEVYYILMVDSALERKYFGFPCALLTNHNEVTCTSGVVDYLTNIRRIYSGSSWSNIIRSMVENNFAYVRDRGDFIAFSKIAMQTQFGFLYARYIARTMANLRRLYALDKIRISAYVPLPVGSTNRDLARRCVDE
jgi:hypothetical protein